jgi:pimeloyl-ACP methyl ester carboxylesterase
MLWFYFMCWICLAYTIPAKADQWVNDAEFKAHYSDSGSESVFNYPLAQLSARVASESYNDSQHCSNFADSNLISNKYYDCALKGAGFKDISTLGFTDATFPADFSTLEDVVTKSIGHNSDSAIVQQLARTSLRAVVGWKNVVVDGKPRRLIAISFRGTRSSPFYDWTIDLSAGTVRYATDDPNTLVHEGFYANEKAMESLESFKTIDNTTLKGIIDNAASSGDLFWITGHSLGGAVATLYAARLLDRGVSRDNIVAYTFGAPSVGNANFRNVFFNEDVGITPAKLAKKINLHRVREKYDLVPYTPYVIFLAYHVQDTLTALSGNVVDALLASARLTSDFAAGIFNHDWTYEQMGYQKVFYGGQEVSSQFDEKQIYVSDRAGLLTNGIVANHSMSLYYGDVKTVGFTAPKDDITLPEIRWSPSNQIHYTTPIEILATMNKAGTIHCTSDGTEPVFNNGNIDVFRKQIEKTTTVKCFAVDQYGNTSKTKFVTYDVDYINPVSAPAYLEIQAPPAVRVLSQTAIETGKPVLMLTPNDKVRLYPRNTPGWPDFKGLAGDIKVWLVDLNDKPYLVSGTLLSDGGVEFSITADMPSNVNYRVIALYSFDGENKILTPGFPLQQVTEIPSSSISPGNNNGTSSNTSGVITLPRTGQYLCYDVAGVVIPCAGTGLDGEIQAGAAWPVPRFVDNGDQTMTDKLTGLIWTKDANAPGPATCGPGTNKTWQEGLDYVACLNANNYLGFTDWRMPNRNELISLINRQQQDSGLWFEKVGFLNTYGVFWASSSSDEYAWDINFRENHVYSNMKNNTMCVWPVHGGQSGSLKLAQTGQTASYAAGDDGALQSGIVWPNPRFTDNGDGTVADNLTGLIWAKNANLIGTPSDWQQAMDYVAAMNSGIGTYGHNDWRLPNVTELQSLIDLSRESLSADNPFINVADYYWSSTTLAASAQVVSVIGGGEIASSKEDPSTLNWIWPIRGGIIDPQTRKSSLQVSFLSENLPDDTYQVGPATKTWRFKSGPLPIVGLRAVQVVGKTDGGLGIEQVFTDTGLGSIDIGDVAANSEFQINLPIEPIHDRPDYSPKSSFWELLDGNGQEVIITNSSTGQFWLKIKTNRPPAFSQLQMDSVAGQVNNQVSLPILASDPDGDTLTYSVVSGGGSIVDGMWQGKPAKLYQNAFSVSGVQPVTIRIDDGHGDSAQYTIQAVISPDGQVKDFYKDVPYPADPVANKQQYDQYLAIHYLTLNGITIGRPDPADASSRIFEGQNVAKQAEALAMVMKAASLRGILDLDAEPRYLPSLLKEDVQNGVYYNFSWAAPYVLKAEELGMIDSADTFDPAAPATRTWLADIVSAMLELDPPLDAITNPAAYSFADAADFTATEDYDNARAMAFFGYMGQLGSASIFNPKDSMIRADVAVVTSRILQTPTIEGFTTTGLGQQLVFDTQRPAITHGQSFTVTGVTNLKAHAILDNGGSISEDWLNSAQDYVKVAVIRVGSGVVAQNVWAKDLPTAPVTVPTNPPDISATEVRNLLVLIEDIKSGVRNISRLDYGVVFPDADGDGVRDDLDKWPNNPLYSTDANNNGIPDNADALWGLTSRHASDSVTINGQSMTLIDAVLSGILAGNAPFDGVCGGANGASYATAPFSNLCNYGMVSAVTGTGPWTWNCSGIGGTEANCSAVPVLLAGVVRDAATLAGIQGIWVTVYNSQTSAFVTSALTDVSGAYAVAGLPAGNYKVNFAGGGTYFSQWYNNKPSINAADVVTVSASSTTTLADVHLVTGGSISGSVKDADTQAGIPGVSVSAYDSLSNSLVASATTDASGTYALTNLQSGNYKIKFDGNGSSHQTLWYNNATTSGGAATVAVTAPNTTTGINATLGPAATITGKVTNSADAGLSGVSVTLYDSNGFTTGTTTDSDGNYVFGSLADGSYRLLFNGSTLGYVSQYHSNNPDIGGASPVAVIVPATTVVNASLKTGGTIAGNVTDTLGAPISGITINILDRNDNVISITGTDASGNYLAKGISSGRHKVRFIGAAKGFASKYYGDTVYPANALPVQVSAPNQTTGINASLAAGGTISGAVTAAGGIPLANVNVQLFDNNSAAITSTVTRADGTYTLTGVPAGTFKAAFFAGSRYAAKWYGGQGNFNAASQITIASVTNTTGINTQLGTGASIYNGGGSRDFGNVPLNSAATYRTFTVFNYGTENLSLGVLALAGTDAAEFSLQNDACSGNTMAPGGNCTFRLFFSPLTAVPKNATITVPSSDPDTPSLTIGIKGTGITTGTISITPASMNFGTIPVGGSTTPQSFTFANDGPGNVTVYSANMTGDAVDFPIFMSGSPTECPDLPHTFVPGESCTLRFNFAPGSGGAKAAAMVTASDAMNVPQLSMTGTGGMGTPQYTLTVSVNGSGTGTVNSITSGVTFTCSAGTRSESYSSGTSLTLAATASFGALFSGWTGDCTNATGDCTLLLDSDRNVTATFDQAPFLRIMGPPPNYYGTLLLAVAAMADGSNVILQGRAVPFSGGFTLDRPVNLTFRGGYDAGFTAVTGQTTIVGSLTVSKGALTAENVAIQ